MNARATRSCRTAAAFTAALLLAACGHLLPSETQKLGSTFESFDAARQALERVVPFRTTVQELRELGFDIDHSPNVTVIPYPELVSRLAPNPSIPLSELDPGIRECIFARMACRTYEFQIGKQDSRREGGFWADFLNFRRLTSVSGWNLKALVVVRDDLVLFRNHGGEPKIVRSELRVNPLGPLQPTGEATGALLTR
jgi:hypothetical protein